MPKLPCLTVLGLVPWLFGAGSVQAAEPPRVEGTLTANGQAVALPYVYVYALDKGFYDPGDPTWKILFVARPVEEHKLDESIWDAAFVELGVTRTREFGEQPELRVYSQNIRFSADGGNISGGTYPEIELESTGPERFAGRVYLPKEEKFFDDRFQYDFTFSTPLSDPNAPIGAALPADGGEPGAAYRAWVEAIHSGDVERLKKLVPAEMAAQLEEEGAKENLELMAAMTPTGVKVLGGSSDGETAILEVEGQMDGEAVHGEVTLQRMDGLWMATRSSWK